MIRMAEMIRIEVYIKAKCFLLKIPGFFLFKMINKIIEIMNLPATSAIGIEYIVKFSRNDIINTSTEKRTTER